MHKIIKLNLLALCICAANQSYALQALNDQILSDVTGQDGISITHEASKVDIKQLNWVDPAEVGKTPIKLGLHNIEVKTATGYNNIKTKLDFDVGTTQLANGTQGVGIQLSASVSPFTATAAQIMLMCSPNCATGETDQNLGSFKLSTISPFEVYLATTNGLFNRDSKVHLDFKLQNASISYGQNNQDLTLKDFNFNLSADGYLYIDETEGVVLTSKGSVGDNLVVLGRVEDKTDVHDSRVGNATNPGLNVDLRYGSANSTHRNLIRIGASGALTNGKIVLNADQTGVAKFNTVNRVNGNVQENEVVASAGYGFKNAGGLHLNVSADFTRAGNSLLGAATPTTFELGHTGTGSYAIEFSNLSPLNVRTSTDPNSAINSQNAYIDFGQIYINNIRTNSMGFVVNDQIKAILGAQNYELIYNPSPTGNASNMAFIAVRGLDFQAIARKARFISDNSIAVNNTNEGTWGLGIPIYNLNANAAFFSKKYTNTVGTVKDGLGYDIAVSTDGYGEDSQGNPKTTSIIVIDGAMSKHGEEVNYYTGLRNIDSYFKANGVIGFNENEIYIKADSLLFAANAEIAIGQLPGALYNCPEGVNSCAKEVVPINNFAKKDDVLASIAFMLDGKGELFIIPGLEAVGGTPQSNYLSFNSNFEFNTLSSTDLSNESKKGSFISLTNTDSNGTATKTSSFNLNKMQGHLGLNGKIHMQKDSVVIDNQVQFNHKALAGGQGTAFRTEVALSPTGTMQKVADIAITGGAMRSTLGITPR
ncbi:DUF6160 family protein [Acinetobacter johnsonii]|uniref:DUF6160 family protein n=1 Tax=Acinetobacter johnsonii TaxID=40214 RepID=UPI0007385F09|nr:DUF6160 family protein [Acinetobacter johnsonii]AXF43275.1 hypothetical protein DT536_00165 [Acinetobacter johnsonii]KUG39476.1 hypothetical protein AAU60_04395 [Acinetobacter johnsonii]MDH1277553.1 hypothetical protein [Acinetobacter johnsonii]MDH1713105.1 hypothetical protein [Acinetobacter johnsonii]MDQ8974804.1 hypothetical protein [Acinetobacter johnsonii]